MDYSGKIIKKTPVVPSQQSASGVWSLDEAMQAQRSNTWPVANVPNPISRSLRFDEPRTTYLNRTPGSSGNRKTYTFSAWIKRSKTGSDSDTIIASFPSGGQFRIFFQTSSPTDTLRLFSFDGTFQFQLVTTQVFRDFSAWGHLVVAIDTTQSTSSDRVKVYWNGLQITAFGTATYPSQNIDLLFNQGSVAHSIGASLSSPITAYFNGYMTEINFIDGQALTPSSFGGTNSATGVWEPRQYTGTYGTNGFYLNFKDNTSTSTLGLDYSGNNNTWTTNNISLTAGSTYDSMLDVPTQWIAYNTGTNEVRGNYATFNPLVQTLTNETTKSLTNGNLNFAVTTANGNIAGALSTITPSSGKWYCEYLVTAVAASPNGANGLGFINVASLASVNMASWGWATPSDGWARGGTSLANNQTAIVTGLTGITTNSLIMFAVDIDAGKMWFGINGTWDNSGNPSAGTNALATFTPGGKSFAIGPNGWANPSNTLATGVMNYGQQPFTYTPPAGFVSLCTTNLPSSTILQGNQYFDALTWTGNGSNPRSFTGLNFAPDFVWAKNRSVGYTHSLYDVLRGAGANKELISASTSAEGGGNQDEFGYLSSFDSAGFTSAAGSSGQNYYFNDVTYPAFVAWNWKANGAGVTNNAGSITSTVSANTTAGFSIVTYTGTGANATVGHGLGVAPKMVIVKDRDRETDWSCLAMPANNGSGQLGWIRLNLTNAWSSTSILWNNTAPTSSVFSIGTYDYVNQPSSRYVAYCFSEVDGYSKIGSYTGNGSSDGPFVYLGFRPKYVLIKSSSTTGGWGVGDTVRSPSNAVDKALYPYLDVAEDTYTWFDAVSNGFKLRSTLAGSNSNGVTYIYMAFAENPFKNALAR
jgi:hypothetical protein